MVFDISFYRQPTVAWFLPLPALSPRLEHREACTSRSYHPHHSAFDQNNAGMKGNIYIKQSLYGGHFSFLTAIYLNRVTSCTQLGKCSGGRKIHSLNYLKHWLDIVYNTLNVHMAANTKVGIKTVWEKDL